MLSPYLLHIIQNFFRHFIIRMLGNYLPQCINKLCIYLLSFLTIIDNDIRHSSDYLVVYTIVVANLNHFKTTEKTVKCLLIFVIFCECNAEVIFCMCIIGVDFDGLSVAFDRLLIFTYTFECNAKIIVCLFIIGVDFDGLSVALDGIIIFSKISECNSLNIVRQRVIGVEFEALFHLNQRFLISLKTIECSSEIAIGLRVLRVNLNCFSVRLNSFSIPFLFKMMFSFF